MADTSTRLEIDRAYSRAIRDARQKHTTAITNARKQFSVAITEAGIDYKNAIWAAEQAYGQARGLFPKGDGG